MNDKQNRIKVILNILLITFMFTSVFGVIIPSLMVLSSSNIPLGGFTKDEIRTILFATIIMFVVVFMFALVVFIKSKPEQTHDEKEEYKK